METGFSELYSPKGRLSRRKFFNLYVLLIIIGILFPKLGGASIPYLELIVSFLIMISSYILYIKRAHDFNKSYLVLLPKIIIDFIFIISMIFLPEAGMNFIMLYLIFTLLYFIVFVSIRGTKGENKYGKDMINIEKKEIL